MNFKIPLIVIAGILLIFSLWFAFPLIKTPAELDAEYLQIQVPAPEGINLTGFEGSWTTMRDRQGNCIRLSLMFAENNPDWKIMAMTRTNPYTRITDSHMVDVRGDVIFDPVFAIFFNREGFERFFQVEDAVVF